MRAIASACEVIRPVDGAISERVRSLKTQDGRVITIIGQNHGDGLKLRSIKDIVNYKNDGNDLWLWTLESVLKSNKKAIQSAKEEVSFLSDFFRKNPDVKYVALEALPATSLDHLKYSEKVRDDLLAESSRRKVSNFLTMPHVLGFAGSAVYLKMTEPGLMKNRVFFGVESEKEVDAHAKLVSRYDDTLSSLKKQVDQPSLEGQDFLQKLDRTEGKLIVLYPTYNSNLDKQILEAALLKTPDKYKKATSDWISASLEEMKGMKKRDDKIAESLLSKDGSTLMTVGHAHLDSVMSILAEKCKK